MRPFLFNVYFLFKNSPLIFAANMLFMTLVR